MGSQQLLDNNKNENSDIVIQSLKKNITINPKVLLCAGKLFQNSIQDNLRLKFSKPYIFAV